MSDVFDQEKSTIARNDLPAWKALEQHRRSLSQFKLENLFQNNPNRFDEFSIILNDLVFDYSKNLITNRSIELLIDLANACGLKQSIEAMFNGEHVNTTEVRPALHTALRNFSGEPVLVDGHDVMPGVLHELNKIEVFVNQLHAHEFLGATGKPITHVVNIGVGGSDLGSVMVTEALSDYEVDNVWVHFVSGIDGTHLNDVLKWLTPDTTLFIISSKSFTTLDTMANAQVAKQWLYDEMANEEGVEKHLAGVSISSEAMSAFGIPEENQFMIWDWVGGRYSLSSAVGLPIAIAIGFNNFKTMLEGMHSIDQHFRETSFEKNIPVIMGLLNIWYINFFDARAQVILPYDSRMHRFPAFLQQLEMESNGKSVTHAGEPVSYHTGTGIWGEVGSNAQHSFYQLLHQGTRFVLADFLVPVNRQSEYPCHHGLSLANCLAQSRALMKGQQGEGILQDLEARQISSEDIDRILPHKTHQGNKPNNTILFKELDPKTLGMLIALYEHKVFVQSVIWDINAFDQWGVELGKQLASELEPVINMGVKGKNLDGSTQGLINFINRWREDEIDPEDPPHC